MMNQIVSKSSFDCIVIGAGIAGITASIYLKRAGINVLLIEKSVPGGQLNNIPLIENYPGFVNIDGPTLASNLYQQLKASDIEIKYDTVIGINDVNSFKNVFTQNEIISTKSIIIATGRVPRKLGFPNEEKLIGRGLSYCAMCDGNLYKEKEVLVIGNGNHALEEILYLSKICSRVTMIHRSDELNGDEILKAELKAKSNISIKYNSIITELLEENGHFKGVLLNDSEVLLSSALFVYMGQEPNIDYLKNYLINTQNNNLIVDSLMKTSVEGVFACGDSIKKQIYQLSTAVGEGATAATEARKYIKSLDK